MSGYPEILAPVGTEEALIAAVRSGADAVYFGTGECNARRFAGRFEGDALLRAVSYCHARNVKTYLTVNTLLRDEELNRAAATLEQIAESGADGMIIQDLAVAKLAQRICPEVERHASTQMAVHNVSGVLELEDMGFSRVVLARELSLKEIQSICERTNAEIEVFVHGALCMSVSGMCYLSASLGERSGNRGTCAQPCRLPFSCGNNAFCLSLKDMSCLAYLPALKVAGVSSFKIEGRMKRPEYVAAAVDAAVKARDGIPYETETLQSVFSRSGFTDGYMTGQRNRKMFGTRTQEDAKQSQQVISAFRGLYRAERPSVPVQASVRVKDGEPVTLSVSDGEHVVSVSGPVPEAAQKTAADREYLARYMQKTGGTPFYIQDTEAAVDEGLAVPGSELNKLRRDALSQLLAIRETTVPHTAVPFAVPVKKDGRHCNEPEYRVRFHRRDQVFSHKAIQSYTLPLEEWKRTEGKIEPNAWCEMPDLIYPGREASILEDLKTLKERGLRDAVCGNIGSIRLAREAGLTVHGGYGLNLTNQLTAETLADMGAEDLTVSFELPFSKMRDLYSPVPLGCIAAGHLPLMQFRSCPARNENGCGDCNGHPVISDRKGMHFPILCHDKQYSTMLNGILYDTADKTLPELDFYILYLSTETKEEGERLFQSVLEHRKPEEERTTGMSFRTLL